MTEKQATESLSQQADQNVDPVQFTPVNIYTTFRAEFAVEGPDLIFHFFLPPEVIGAGEMLAGHPVRLKELDTRVRKYWLDHFPRTLDVVARGFFKAEAPRLQASYVEEYELKSWWLRCFGFANQGLDPAARCQLFLEHLDQALDAVKVNVLLV